MNLFNYLFLRLKGILRPVKLIGQLASMFFVLFLAGCGGKLWTTEEEFFQPDFGGAVFGDEPRAVLEGNKVLARGGSAADAATAMYFALSATLPSAASLGGGGACLISNPAVKKEERKIEALEFYNNPAGVNRNSFERSSIPGNVSGIYALHSRYGILRWSEMVSAGERLARFGAPVSKALSKSIARVPRLFPKTSDLDNMFNPSNGSIRAGKIWTQRELANVLANIRTKGPAGFYQGIYGKRFVDGVNAKGGKLSVRDLRSYKPRWVEPLKIKIGKKFMSRTNAYFLPPPSAAGLYEARILGMLSRLSLFPNKNLGSIYNGLADAQLVAYNNQNKKFNGKERFNWPVNRSIFEAELNRMRASLTKLKSDIKAPAEPSENKQINKYFSTSFVAVDEFGMAVACGFTMDGEFGSGNIATGTGIIIASNQNSSIERPILIGPMMILNVFSDQFYLAAATSHGYEGVSALTTTAARIYLNDESLESSLAAPRLHYNLTDNITYIEPSLNNLISEGLARHGYNVRASRLPLGLVNIVYCSGGIPKDSGTCAVEHDPRGHGLSVIGALEE
ncbi:MAG: gamma-glutamyltransferase [Pseudomonadota bacterium]|nr:gamma-glutamyltransferase [Pseudomonadota bacterium]